MNKQCKVVMIATDRDSPYGIGGIAICAKPYDNNKLRSGIVNIITKHGHDWSNEFGGIIQGIGKPQHLYIISDDEIKEGDKVLVNDMTIATFDRISNSKCDALFKEEGIGYHTAGGYDAEKWLIGHCKKIIATTDSSLKIIIPRHNDFDSEYKLPSIPKSFIDKYISEYNKGNKIEEVMVDYELDINDAFVDEAVKETVGKPYDYSKCKCWNLKLNPDNTINIQSVKDSWNREEVIDLLSRYGMWRTSNLTISIDKFIEENL